MNDPMYCFPLEILCQPLSWWSSAASWAQAILSALAILGASYVAKRQHDRVTAQQVGAICGTVQMAVDILRSYKTVISQVFANKEVIDADRRRLDVIATALSSAPIHEIPDHRLAIWIFTAGEILAQAGDSVDVMRGSSDRDAVEQQIEQLGLFLEQAEKCLAKVRAIDREYSKG
jgi:hypothetical protein